MVQVSPKFGLIVGLQDSPSTLTGMVTKQIETQAGKGNVAINGFGSVDASELQSGPDKENQGVRLENSERFSREQLLEALRGNMLPWKTSGIAVPSTSNGRLQVTIRDIG